MTITATSASCNSVPKQQLGIQANNPDVIKCSSANGNSDTPALDTPVCGEPQDVVPPEEAVPSRDNDEDIITKQKTPEQTDSFNQQNGNGETQVILKHLLQKMQQQEYSIQKLQGTVESQNATLQALMTTMQAGFAALVEKEPKAAASTEPPLQRLISPERDHPSISLTKEENPIRVKDCLIGDGKVPTKVKDPQNDCDASISILQLQDPSRTQPEKPTKERSAAKVPSRAKMHQSEMSDLGMSASINETPPAPSKLWFDNLKPERKAGTQPVFGTKSSSMLLDDDDDDSTISTNDPIHEAINMDLSQSQNDHHANGELPPRVSLASAPPRAPFFGTILGRTSSCRGQLPNMSRGSKDKCPSPPIYFPSPLTHNSANRQPTRFARATSAPMSTFRRRGADMPKLPTRLPTREDSVSEGLDGSNINLDESSKGGGPKANANPNFFAALPPIKRTSPSQPSRSPRLPTRNSGTQEGPDLTKIERSVTDHTTSTCTTMPRIPSRYASVSDGLDATRWDGASATASTGNNDDAGLNVSAPKEQQVVEEKQTDDNYNQEEVSLSNTAPSKNISLDNQESSTSTNAGTSTITSEQLSQRPALVNRSLSWTRYKQLAATTSQQTHAASTSCCEDVLVPPKRRNSRQGSFRRDIFAKQGLAHLHVSCVTLDSALVDETHEWIGDDNDVTSFVDESGEGHEQERKSLDKSDTDATEGMPQSVVAENKKLADATGDTGFYTGTVAMDNMPNGKGAMRYDNGKFYEGEWENGNWHGTGVLLSANGDSYRGDFAYSTRHGHGVYSYDNGDTYDGAFNADKPHGVGVFKFADHSVYKGGFIFGSFEGQGWYEFDGGRYEGEWKGGCYDGSGCLRFGDGGCYTGQFQAGKAHGIGEEVSADGVSRKGTWRNGDFVKKEDA